MPEPMENCADDSESEMKHVLEGLLARDDEITARAVARLHPSIKAASSITRSPVRSRLLANYQERQAEYRKWRGRIAKQSGTALAATMTEKDRKIMKLERQLALLTASHVAMIRAVGELGGFSKWAKFYEDYRATREEIASLGALPLAEVSPLPTFSKRKPRKDA